MTEISSGILVQIFFGINPDQPHFAWLIKRYQQLGELNLAWSIEEKQKTIFNEIRDYFLNELNDQAIINPDSILGKLRSLGLMDETLLGNLIYMVEMGRHDMSGLFRWLSKYASEYPEILSQIAAETVELSSEEMTLTRAFVSETLRMDQIERLLRIAERDLMHGDYAIPKGSFARFCLWESHKDPDNFPEPFTFQPNRFIENKYSLKEYAPFGIDHHRCPLGQVSMRMAMLLLKTLATHYAVEPVGSGPATRGPFHWQPADTFSVRLKPRV